MGPSSEVCPIVSFARSGVGGSGGCALKSVSASSPYDLEAGWPKSASPSVDGCGIAALAPCDSRAPGNGVGELVGFAWLGAVGSDGCALRSVSVSSPCGLEAW